MKKPTLVQTLVIVIVIVVAAGVSSSVILGLELLEKHSSTHWVHVMLDDPEHAQELIINNMDHDDQINLMGMIVENMTEPKQTDSEHKESKHYKSGK